MKWTTLYRKGQKMVFYYNIWIDAQVVHLETGCLTTHRTEYHISTPFSTITETEEYASIYWNSLKKTGWKSAQELGINSNNQTWTPFTSGSLEELLQKLLP
jgi:hypothetical protein